GQPVLYHIDGNNLIGYVESNATAGYQATDHQIFSLTINQTAGVDDGTYTFTLYDKIDHHPNTQFPAPDNVEDFVSLNLNGVVQVTDGNSSTINLNGEIKIIDDVPVAVNDIKAAVEGGTPSVNLVLIIDTSGSMGDDPGVPGFATRLALAKAAAINL